MTDEFDAGERGIAAFMGRVADAHGRREAAPDADLVWLRARLEQRFERAQRTRSASLLSFKLSLIAIAISAFAAVRFTLPVLAGSGDIALTTGLTLAAIVPLIWFLGLRPLRDAR
jgi:hypothetical protein